jgi:hypothetical protein
VVLKAKENLAECRKIARFVVGRARTQFGPHCSSFCFRMHTERARDNEVVGRYPVGIVVLGILWDLCIVKEGKNVADFRE